MPGVSSTRHTPSRPSASPPPRQSSPRNRPSRSKNSRRIKSRKGTTFSGYRVIGPMTKTARIMSGSAVSGGCRRPPGRGWPVAGRRPARAGNGRAVSGPRFRNKRPSWNICPNRRSPWMRMAPASRPLRPNRCMSRGHGSTAPVMSGVRAIGLLTGPIGSGCRPIIAGLRADTCSSTATGTIRSAPGACCSPPATSRRRCTQPPAMFTRRLTSSANLACTVRSSAVAGTDRTTSAITSPQATPASASPRGAAM